MNKIKNLEELSAFLVEQYHVELAFIPDVVKDIKAINKGNRTHVLAMIILRAKKGPLFVPDGVAKSLNGDLNGYAKIKSKSLNVRIIYRPVPGSPIRMELIAIGPREKKKVYTMAAERLL